MFTRLDYSSALEYSIIRRYTNIVYYYYDKISFHYMCSCGDCHPMLTVAECVCCLEVENIVEKIHEGELFHGKRMPCICDHPGLNSVCLDHYGLQVARFAYSQQYGGKAFEGRQDAEYSHIAYRQLVEVVLGIPWKGKPSNTSFMCSVMYMCAFPHTRR